MLNELFTVLALAQSTRYIYNTDSTRHRSAEEDTHHPSRLACCYEKANGMDVFCLRLGRVKVRKLHRSEFTLPSFGLVHANVSTFKDEIIFFLIPCLRTVT